MNYYNDHDEYVCQWLANLIEADLIPRGIVDDRPIEAINYRVLNNYEQCHFFAGIGGWSRALELADWPQDKAVWTGSCPCQPFSVAGKREGVADARHLWPAFRFLVGKCAPPVVFGEQVASKDGREWLAGVRTDLEGMGYAVGAADLCAASAGAPHIRQRLWWVADGAANRWRQERADGRGGVEGNAAEGRAAGPRLRGASRGLADGERSGLEVGRGIAGDAKEERTAALGSGDAGGVDFAPDPDGRRQGGSEYSRRRTEKARGSGFWSSFGSVPCWDGKVRRIEPGTFPLATGIPARMGKLRAYGNSIVPQVAAEFIRAYVEALDAAADAPLAKTILP